MKYRIKNESIARESFQKPINGLIKPAGMFIRQMLPYLAASPDSLIGSDAHIEIKCPSSIKEYTPKETVNMTKLKCMVYCKSKLNLIQNDNYNYQVQAKLKKKSHCYFMIRTPKGSINLICVPLGCMLSGILTQPFGRKLSMIALTCPFMVAWMILYFSSTVTQLYLALTLMRICGGLLEAPVLTYISEITEPHLRGVLSALTTTTCILGIVSQFILGNFLHWRIVVLFNTVIPVVTFISLLFVPESPHWLISKNRIADAEKSLCWLRGWVKPEVVQHELSMLTNSINLKEENIRMKKNKNSFYTKRTFLLPYFIITAAFFFGNFGGMNTLQVYSVQIFETLGSPINGYTCTLILGMVQLMGAVICSSLVHWTGKRPLTMISMAGSSVCFFVVAAYAYVKHYNEEIILNVTWIPLVFLNTAAFMMHVSIKILPWTLIGEVYPLNIRAQASGISGSSNYIFAFIMNKSYFMVIDYIDLPGIFLVFATVSIIGCVTLYTILPETEGVSLDDIQEHFRKKSNTFVTTIVRTDKNNKKKSWDATNLSLKLNHTEK